MRRPPGACARARPRRPLSVPAGAATGWFVELVGPTPSMRIVDVGCGPAGLRAWAPGLDITGVDVRPQAEYPGPFVQADAGDGLPFADGEFDFAYSNSLIEHIAPAARERFAAEISARRARLVGADAGLRLPGRAACAAAGRALAAGRPAAPLLAAGRGRRVGGDRADAPPRAARAVRPRGAAREDRAGSPRVGSRSGACEPAALDRRERLVDRVGVGARMLGLELGQPLGRELAGVLLLDPLQPLGARRLLARVDDDLLGLARTCRSRGTARPPGAPAAPS